MQRYRFLSLFLILFVSNVYAGWDQQCLDDCFSTHHECKYCSYQCYSEDYDHPVPHYHHTPCPLQGYEDDNNN